MPFLLTDLVAIIALSPSFMVGLFSWRQGVFCYAFLILLFWLVVFLVNHLAAPRMRKLGKSQGFSPEQRKVYRKYYWHINFPIAASLAAGMLHRFRLLGLLVGALCLWKGVYWLGAFFVLYFPLAGWQIVILKPDFYLVDAAEEGDLTARNDLPKLWIVKYLNKKKIARL